MRKYTQKELKNLAKIGAAQDLTGYSFQQMNDFFTRSQAGQDRLFFRGLWYQWGTFARHGKRQLVRYHRQKYRSLHGVLIQSPGRRRPALMQP